MYWKYHIEKSDLLRFTYRDADGNPHRAEGTCLGIVLPEGEDPDQEHDSVDDIDLSEFKARINSGGIRVTVSLDDVHERLKAEDRESDLPLMSEGLLRWDGGIKQNDHDVDDIADCHNPSKGR